MAIQDFLNGVKDRAGMGVADPDADPELEAPVSEPDPFDEIVASMGEAPAQDPKPARRRGRPASGGGGAAAKVTAAQRRAVADALEMMITLPAGVVALKDPVCGGAVLEHCDNIVKKLTPIVCRNPAMVEWFTTGTGYLDWFGLATALWPVGTVIWAHHVTRPRDEEGHDGHPAAAPDFSHYTAPSLG